MIRRLKSYLFPPIRLAQRLPLPPRWYSSRQGEPVPDELKEKVYFLKAWGLCYTDQDAMRLIRLYPGKSIQEIRKLEGRGRKRVDRWKTFKRRLMRLWNGK